METPDEDPCSVVMNSLLCETTWVEATELFSRKYLGKQQPIMLAIVLLHWTTFLFIVII